ncbi:MAG: SDR family oxidoreductase [Oligoflexia bacterium]|nr:SDR family oxidoreductase [Oligoflexia bacterium]
MNILITGGASGLGGAITDHLAQNNPHSKIHFTFYSSLDKATYLEHRFSNTVKHACNFHDKASVHHLLEQMNDMNLDVLINNAYLRPQIQYFHKEDLATFELSFKHNILPVINITQAALSLFRKKKQGRIISILSSALINKPPLGWSEYTANKAYIESLSKSWASENSKFNITANCISPSFMQTNMSSLIDERMVSEMIEQAPFKKLLTPTEVAESVHFLLHCSPYINGINLVMNGGAHVI